MMIKLGFVLVALTAVGCSKDKGSAPAKPLDVAGVNALVPASLKDKLVFEERTIEEERGKRTRKYTLAAPKDWEPGFKGFAQLKPKDDAMGFFTKVSVGTNCDGACESKDWAAVVEKVYANYLKGKIVKDEKTKTGRSLIAEADDRTVVLVAAYGDTNYSYCEATLEKPLAEAAPAFAKACESVAIKD